MSDALLGFGTLVQTEVSGAWRTVAEVTEITPPSMQRDVIDTTHEHGPYEWRDSLPGMKTPGELTLTLNFIPGNETYAEMKAEFDDELVRSRRIVFPNGVIMPFNAFITAFEPEAPSTEKLSATVKFQVVGETGTYA